MDTSVDTLDISLQSMGTPLCDETILEENTSQIDVSMLCDVTPLDLSTSSIPISQQDLFSSTAPVEQHYHIPVRDISLLGTRLPPLQSAHSISPLVRSSSESVVGSQTNIFGSQCAFSPDIVQPKMTKKGKNKTFYPFNVDLIDRGTSSLQVTDYTCSPEFSTILRLLGQQNEILPSEISTDQILENEYIVRLPPPPVLDAIHSDFLAAMRLSQDSGSNVYPPQPNFINRIDPVSLPVVFSVDNPHQRLVTSVPEAYSVLLSEVGRKHPMSNQVRFPSTAVNAMELSAIHASQIAVHQQRSNNLILENMTEACTDSDKLKQLIMENGNSMPAEAKSQLISLLDDLSIRLSTSCLASCISAYVRRFIIRTYSVQSSFL